MNKLEKIVISGTVERLNSKGANGSVEINIPLLNLIKIMKKHK